MFYTGTDNHACIGHSNNTRKPKKNNIQKYMNKKKKCQTVSKNFGSHACSSLFFPISQWAFRCSFWCQTFKILIWSDFQIENKGIPTNFSLTLGPKGPDRHLTQTDVLFCSFLGFFFFWQNILCMESSDLNENVAHLF